MNITDNPELVDKLAAEYVLGTLKGGARRRFEAWSLEHAEVSAAIADWRQRLHPMADLAPSVPPPPQVWQAISAQLALPGATGKAKVQGRNSFWQRLLENLQFWRGLGMASSAFAMVLVTMLLIRQPEPAAPPYSYMAMLADDQARPMAVVTGDMRRRELTVRVVAGQHIAADKSLELWAVPKQGAPRSLGLLAAAGSMSMPMPENSMPESAPMLAVTLEPKGGSPDPQGPTGPVMFKGAWVRV